MTLGEWLIASVVAACAAILAGWVLESLGAPVPARLAASVLIGFGTGRLLA